MKKFYITLAALLMYCGTALAETIDGTVTNIDLNGRKVTLSRSNTLEEFTVLVDDANSLSRLRTGSLVNFDATKGTDGVWNTRSIQTTTTGLGGTNTSSIATPAGVNVNAPTLTSGPATSTSSTGITTLGTGTDSLSSTGGTSSSTGSSGVSGVSGSSSMGASGTSSAR